MGYSPLLTVRQVLLVQLAYELLSYYKFTYYKNSTCEFAYKLAYELTYDL